MHQGRSEFQCWAVDSEGLYSVMFQLKLTFSVLASGCLQSRLVVMNYFALPLRLRLLAARMASGIQLH